MIQNHQIYLAEQDREKTSYSVNGGKYEFQRAIDDVLREHTGRICYVDDVIIFSENESDHVKHIDSVEKLV